MAISKIEKYHLEDEAQQLKDMGFGNEKIASTLVQNHPKIKGIKKLSGMSVGRYFRKKDKEDIVDTVEQGGDPVIDFIQEYRDSISDINKRTKSLYNKSMAILKDIEENSDDDHLKLKALKEVRDSLEQMRKNNVSLVQYGERRIDTIKEVNLKQEYHVKNLLIGISRELCPKCRAKIPQFLEIEEEE